MDQSSVSQPIDPYSNQWINQSVSQRIDLHTKQWIHQSVSQSASQSINQSLNQSINQHAVFWLGGSSGESADNHWKSTYTKHRMFKGGQHDDQLLFGTPLCITQPMV